MAKNWNNSTLEAYLDEGLPSDQMSDLEAALRDDESLCERLAEINRRRDAGVHTLGEIWRRHRLSCPSRERLGSYLLGVLDDGEVGYIQFHLEVVGCRYCTANLQDLQSRQSENSTTADARRRKYFQSSAGYLKGED